MKVLWSWLAEFAPELSGDPHAIGDVLSDIGLTCEGVEVLGRGLDGIVVARVLALRPHPDADRIQLVDVDRGDGEALQIACGAFNMSEGDLVPLATLGTVMPNGMEIARRKMRGEWSNGMLCSSAELGLSGDHQGILLLGPDLEPGVGPGTPLKEALGVTDDVLFDLDLTPNRPDALSVVGVARDLAAKLGIPFVVPEITVAESGTPAGDEAAVEILDPTLCGRFTGRVLSGIEVGRSSTAIARRLTLMGMRPINSIVDISNYVMLEYGQPNHTFDLDKVAGHRLRIRRATGGETIETLDGQVRTLVEGDGVIADGGDVPIGIAAVMGGASTEISDTTTRVLLELAWWDPASIGRTSTRLGLRSEASSRFEKGVDPEIAGQAAARFAQLAAATGATVHPGSIVVEGRLPARTPVLVRTERVNAVLGSSLTTPEIRAYLDPIGFVTTAAPDAPATPGTPAGEAVEVALPSWRPDATAEIDVIEEVARHHGYDRLGQSVPVSPRRGGLTDRQHAVRALRELLVGMGLTEITPIPFLAPADLEAAGVSTAGVAVTNPLIADESVLRTSLIPGALKALAYNARHRRTGLSVFEIGHCFVAGPSRDVMPHEFEDLGVALAGRDAAEAVRVAHRLLVGLGYGAPHVADGDRSGDPRLGALHPYRRAALSLPGRPGVVGVVGELDPRAAARFGVDEPVAWVELRLDDLLAEDRPVAQARPVSRYPSADIDLAFVVPDEVGANDVADRMAAADPLVVGVSLFDVFRSEAVGEGRRSLAYAVRLQAGDRTLTDDDVAAVRSRLIEVVRAGFGATLRG